MPGLSEERRRQIEELFDAALDQDVTGRDDWLAGACGADEELLTEVKRLLAAHDKAEGILEKPVKTIAPWLHTEAQDELMLSKPAGPYRLVSRIGRGGLGVVYKALDPRLDRFVALKFLPHHLEENETAKTNFIVEAKATSALDHRNICTVHDIGETEDGQLYIAMACYEGQTLEREIERGPLPTTEALEIAAQITEGLGAAHEAGIIHRDIKPSNIAVTEQDEVKILDFGVAKLEREGAGVSAGARIGTLSYMSPEQARGEEVDARTDLWSLGAVLYELLTGKRLVAGEGETAILKTLLGEDLRLPVSPGAGLPAGVGKILDRLLSPSPVDRHTDAKELLGELRAALRVAGASQASSLPPDLSSFIGREEEIQRARSLLSTVRLLTFTGPAGTGKTRLALQTAELSVADFPDGAFFVSLSPIADPDLVPAEIAKSIGVPATPTQSIVDSLRDALREKQSLLVLDNFEQVSAAAPVVAQLLSTCPGLVMIVTSRVALRLSGEHQFPVPALALPEPGAQHSSEELLEHSAIRLFVERGSAARPGFALTDENAGAIADLCLRLDGLPLAIELAAARSRLMSPSELLARIGRRLDLLKGGPRDRPARHQTLRQAIAWSYDLLTPEEQRLFRSLAIFVGGFSLEAAEAVIGTGDTEGLDLLDGLETLSDHSLIGRREDITAETRFFMLDTIRDFALEKLEESGEGESLSHAHGDFFVGLAERAEPHFTGEEQARWMTRVEADHDNFRAVLSWAEQRKHSETGLGLGAALWRLWLVRGYVNEGCSWLERMIALPQSDETTAARTRVLQGLATLLQVLGRNWEARARLEECLDLLRAADDTRGIAVALNNLAWVAAELSDLTITVKLSEEALELHRQRGDKRGIALAINNLAWVENYRGNPGRALELHRQSFALRGEIKDQRGVAFALINMAWSEFMLGSYADAESHLDDAMTILHALGDRHLIGYAIFASALLAYGKGESTRAAAIIEESSEVWKTIGNLSIMAWERGLAGDIYLDQARLDDAAAALEASLSLWKDVGTSWGVAWILNSKGLLTQMQGDLKGALAYYRESLGIRRGVLDRHGLAVCLEGIANLALTVGDAATAARLLGHATGLREEMHLPRTAREKPWIAVLQEGLASALGSEESARLQAEGRDLSLQEACDLALVSPSI